MGEGEAPIRRRPGGSTGGRKRPMALDVVLVVALGTLLCLDVRAVLQGMVSHPVVAGTLVGGLLGEASQGLEIGILVGLLWVHVLPVGGVIPPNDTIIAILATALWVLVGGERAGACLALVLAVPFGLLLRELDGALRRLNVTVSRSVVAADADRLGGTLAASQLLGVLSVGVVSAACLALGLGGGLLVLPLLLHTLPEPVLLGLATGYATLPWIGVAAVLSTLTQRRSWALFGVVSVGVIAAILGGFRVP